MPTCHASRLLQVDQLLSRLQSPKIAAAEKLPIHLTALNVDDDASVHEAFAKVVAEHGPIDVLVNNAGIPGGDVVEETTIDRFRQVMETNFFGALRCTKAVVPRMRERRHGRSSTSARSPAGSPGEPLELCSVEMCARSGKRVARAGIAAIQRARRHCRARRDRNPDLHKGAGAHGGKSISVPQATHGDVRRFAPKPIRPRSSATQSATSLQATACDCAIPSGRTPSFGSRRAPTRRTSRWFWRKRERRRIRPADETRTRDRC